MLVTGRLRIREYAKDGQLRYSVEIEAVTVGYDMTRGISRFERVSRTGATTAEDIREALAGNDRWASDLGPAPDPAGEGAEGAEEATAPVGYPGDGSRSDDDDEEEDGREYDPYDARTAAA